MVHDPIDNEPVRHAAVSAVFRDRGHATRAVRRLAEKSVPADTIRVFLLADDDTRRHEIPVEDEAGALRGALIGAGVGAVVGVGVVALATSGVLGPIQSEPLGVRTVLGAARAVLMAAVAGVPLGALLGMGHWQGRKKLAETGDSTSPVEVAVESEAVRETALDVLREAGADRIVS